MVATANTSLDVTELSFDQNRASLKAFLQSRPELKDYNYEGSTLSILLDLLSYASYNMGYYANMSANEGFLDTAVLRDSVVSRAKALAYTPRSAKSARATLTVTVVPDDDPASITITKGTRFSSTLNSRRYRWEVENDVTITKDADGYYIGDVSIVEGVTLTERFTVSGTAPHRFVLSNQNIDTDSLVVVVKPSAASADQTVYSEAYDVTEAGTNDRIYFVEADRDNKFVLQFGDGTIGRALVAGEQVVVSYRVTEGKIVNGVGVFSAVNNLGGYNDYSFVVSERATGGQDIESTESVRFHAPRRWEMQNRCVTAGDYKEFVLSEHSDIEALAVWGGEDNDPPIYGRVFICAKPYNGFTLAQYKKDAIFNSLEKYNVQSVEPILVDATFLYVVPNVRVFFDRNATTQNAAGIHAKVATKLLAYESSYLGTFEQRFRNSTFIASLTSADNAIRNIEVATTLQKRFEPTLNSIFSYTLKFNHAIHHPTDSNPVPVVASSAFTIPAYSYTMYLDDDGSGNLRIYYKNTKGGKVYVNRTAGTVDYASGEVKITNFAPSSYVGSEIKIAVTPEYQSYVPVRNQIILLADATVSVWREDAGREETAAYSAAVVTQGTTETLLETAVGA